MGLFSVLICVVLSALPALATYVQETSAAIKLNKELQSELLKIGADDQRYREAIEQHLLKMSAAGNATASDEYRAVLQQQDELDRSNIVKLEKIILQHGWPGKSLVGEAASKAAFLILQHADPIYKKRYFPQLKAAAAQGEARASDVAMMEDRILMGDGKKQRYGTQLHSGPQTGGKIELYPIEDEASVDARRAAVGLPPMAEYLKHFGLEYQPPRKP